MAKTTSKASVKGTDTVKIKLPSVDVYEQNGSVVITGKTLAKLAKRCSMHNPPLAIPDGIATLLNEVADSLCSKKVGQPKAAKRGKVR